MLGRCVIVDIVAALIFDLDLYKMCCLGCLLLLLFCGAIFRLNMIKDHQNGNTIRDICFIGDMNYEIIQLPR